MTRGLGLWILGDCLRQFVRMRYWWAVHGDGPGVHESMADWWART